MATEGCGGRGYEGTDQHCQRGQDCGFSGSLARRIRRLTCLKFSGFKLGHSVIDALLSLVLRDAGAPRNLLREVSAIGRGQIPRAPPSCKYARSFRVSIAGAGSGTRLRLRRSKQHINVIRVYGIAAL